MTRSLLLTTAITVPLASTAVAQTVADFSEEELSSKSEACRSLAEAYRGLSGDLVVLQENIFAAVDADAEEDCQVLRQRVTDSSQTTTQSTTENETTSDSQNDPQSETVSDQVDLTEEATIEGQAEVTIPDPDVDVAVPAPSVTVNKQQPQVTVAGRSADIQVDQKQPKVTVEIPDIIVRIQMPAPDIYVLSSDPDIRINSNDPQVQVEQGDPKVTVTQADPELNVDLGVDVDESGSGTNQAANVQNTEGGSDSAGDQTQNVDADTEVANSEAQVEIVQAEGEPEIAYEQSDPNVSFESAEPEVSVLMAEQPTIEIQQDGEPNVVIETAEEREQRLSQRQSEEAAETGTMTTVDDLLEMDVVTADGEELGNPEAVVDINGSPNLVLNSGGFLGLGGKQVPVPLSRVTQQDDDELVVTGMTESDIEAANDFEYDDNLELADDQEVRIGGN